MLTRRLAFTLAACAAIMFPATAAPQGQDGHPVEIRVTDLTHRFLAFYHAALEEDADADRRWELWQEHYGFAALPPVPERDSIAREMLEEAWPRYPEVMDRVRRGVAGMKPAPEPLLRAVADTLGADVPILVDLLVYVGALEGNAFFAPQQGRLTVAIPIEESPDHRTLSLAHEFTHAVHHVLAGHSEGWERSIARTLFDEGLAVWATRAVLPGHAPEAYLEGRPGWLAEARASESPILGGILPYLRDTESEQVMRFTMGPGTTGLEREAYYTGWVVVGHLLERGHSLAELARIHQDAIPDLVERAIRSILAAG